MISRKIILLILISLFLSLVVQPALSVPAAPGFHTLEQKDGSTFMAKLIGDENYHVWESSDNYSIVFDETTMDWTYAILDPEGNLSISKNVVGKDAPPNNIPKHLRPNKKAPEKISKYTTSQSSTATTPANILTSSTVSANIPVILINFADRTTTFTNEEFNTLLFSTGTKSMKDYFEEVSYGKFTVSPGPSDVVGWYQASETHDYYGKNVRGYDRYPAELVIEAIIAADNAGFDFAPYDMDGDCLVDVVDIIHQGSGEEAGGDAKDIWSHSWDLDSAKVYGDGSGNYTTDDFSATCGRNVSVNDYVIQPETLFGSQQTIGVFAHEYGHALGLPDLYDTNGDSEGIGEWSLMASGSWNSVPGGLAGDTPAHMDAWSKSFLGWVNPTVLDKSAFEYIDQAANNSEVFQLLNNPDGAGDWTSGGTGGGEYFLIENRRKIGFDAALPGEGLLIWHIDESMGNNQDENHKLVDLEEADGLNDLDNGVNRGDAFDPWYISSIGFTESTNPNSKLYNNKPSSVRVKNISASASIMTANLILIEWDSYSSPAYDIPENNYEGGDSTVYMHGTDLDPGYDHKIAYYDGDDLKVSTETKKADSNGNLSSNYTFKSTENSGEWHAQVFNASANPSITYSAIDPNIIVDDSFTVTDLALPEFSAGITIPFFVSFIVYIILRKKITNG